VANPVVHFEIVGKEPEKLQQFYSGIFDWEIDTDNPMNYGMVAAKGDRDYGINGGIGGPPDPTYPGHLTFYVEVEAIDPVLAKIDELGGKTVMERTELPMVTMAMFTDPSGNLVGLVEPPRQPA
jgi:predicted enzyme related to lactoylglutathione lyase